MIVNVEIPNEIYDRALEIAESQSISIADLFASACAEHIAAWDGWRSRAAGRPRQVPRTAGACARREPDERDRF